MKAEGSTGRGGILAPDAGLLEGLTDSERAIRAGIGTWGPQRPDRIARDAGVTVEEVRQFIAANLARTSLHGKEAA